MQYLLLLYNSKMFNRIMIKIRKLSVIILLDVASTCHHGDVRLFGGYSKSDGIAETCINGQWTSICSQGWDEIDSIKFCRQLLGRENVGMHSLIYNSGIIIIATCIIESKFLSSYSHCNVVIPLC